MTEQLEQATEIQAIADEISAMLKGAFDLLIERRDSMYADAIATLTPEGDNLGKEYAAIGEAARNLAELLPAKARVAQAEHDRLLLAGDREGAALKLAEQKEADHAAEAMRARQAAITTRLEAIEEEKRAHARRIFRAWHGECKALIRPIEHGLFVVILDGLRNSFFDFQARTDTVGAGVLNNLFNQDDIADLTAPERSEEWRLAVTWYGVRR
jgi:hypothetical protein